MIDQSLWFIALVCDGAYVLRLTSIRVRRPLLVCPRNGSPYMFVSRLRLIDSIVRFNFFFFFIFCSFSIINPIIFSAFAYTEQLRFIVRLRITLRLKLFPYVEDSDEANRKDYFIFDLQISKKEYLKNQKRFLHRNVSVYLFYVSVKRSFKRKKGKKKKIFDCGT